MYENWQHGWDMRALNYCVDTVYEGGRFKSMQVVLGHEDVPNDPEIPLQRHGGTGGECYTWRLPDHDYIVRVQYQFDWITGFVDAVQFMTASGQMKEIGSGTGPMIVYYYNVEKQFSGIISYEFSGRTYAFGALDSVCNHLTEEDFAKEIPSEVAKEPEWTPTSDQGMTATVKEKVGDDTPLDSKPDVQMGSAEKPDGVTLIAAQQAIEDQADQIELQTELISKLSTRIDELETSLVQNEVLDIPEKKITKKDDEKVDDEEGLNLALSRLLFPILVIATWLCLCVLLCKIRSVERVVQHSSGRQQNDQDRRHQEFQMSYRT